MKTKVALLIIAVALLAADVQENDSVIGKWKWIKSVFVTRGMKEPVISKPKSRKDDIFLYINQKEIVVMNNGDSVAVAPYLFYHQTDDLDVLRVSNLKEENSFYISSGPVYLTGDTMIIGGGYNDAGSDQYYLRINDKN